MRFNDTHRSSAGILFLGTLFAAVARVVTNAIRITDYVQPSLSGLDRRYTGVA